MTKRKVKRKIEELENATDDDGHGPAVIDCAHVKGSGENEAYADMSDSPHPELTVRPRPEEEPRNLRLAVPNHIPQQYLSHDVLFVETCQDDGERIPACELWEAMTQEELHTEYEQRKASGEPIPDLLTELEG